MKVNASNLGYLQDHATSIKAATQKNNLHFEFSSNLLVFEKIYFYLSTRILFSPMILRLRNENKQTKKNRHSPS